MGRKEIEQAKGGGSKRLQVLGAILKNVVNGEKRVT